MKDSSEKEKALPHSIHALLQPKGMEEPALSTFYLFGEPLVCLLLNGEERLCLAQISSRLLRGYSYNEIHNRRVALGITCVQCSPRQLELLRRVGAMPLSSRRCGTITKREAQRLVESFLQHLPAPPRLPENFAFEVVHHCGWGCSGLFVPTRYNSSRAKCVQCALCHVFFSPNKFIFHCHNAAETGVQQQVVNYRHPDAANFNAWRRHLLLADPNPPDSLLFAWEDIKAMFNGGNRSKKASLPSLPSATCTTNSTITTTVEAVEEDPNEAKTSTAAYAPPKRPTLLGATPLLPTDVLMMKPQAVLSSLVSQHTLQIPNYLWLGGVTSEGNDSGVQYEEHSAKRPRTSAIPEISVHPSSSRLPSQLSISRLEGVQIPTAPSSMPIDVDVDLDAADDRSEYSTGSRASVSTSGVSSLLPRSYRDDRAVVKPSHRDYKSEYSGQGNSSNRNKGIIGLWTDLEGSDQSPLSMTHSAPKRMRTETTRSSVSDAFSSPFYRGKVSYGGASSLRCTPQSRDVFEPLKKSTTRYPSYMATYNRYKELKRQFAAQSSIPSAPPQFSIIPDRIGEHDNEDVAHRKSDTTAMAKSPIFEVSSGSSQALKSTSFKSHDVVVVSEKSQQTVISPFSGSLASSNTVHEGADKVVSQIPSTVLDVCTPVKVSTETEFSSPNRTRFIFSNPIALKPPTRPPATLSDASEFAFSYPKSQFKRPAPVENSSFLPTLMSCRQPAMSGHPCPSKKASISSGLDLWRCESCLMENSGSDGVCKSCRLPTSVPSFSKSNSLTKTSDKPAFLGNLPSNGWECPTCMVKNKVGVSECVFCRTPNSSGMATTDASKDKGASVPVFNFGPPKSVSSTESVSVVSARDQEPIPGFGLKFGTSVTSSSNPPKAAKPTIQSSLISSEGWNCPTCLVKNDNSLEECPCCKTTKPKSSDSSASRAVDCAPIPGFNFSNPVGNNVAPTTVSFRFGNDSDKTATTNFKFGDFAVRKSEIGIKFDKTEKNKWECPTCMVKNSDDIASCPCCQTKRPTFLPKPASSIPNESGDKWVCPTCLVKNDAFVDLCPCCQTKKPLKSSSASGDGSIFGSPAQYAGSPPVVMSTLRQSSNLDSRNSNTSSGPSFPTVTVGVSSFSFSKPADTSNTSAKGFELPATPSIPSKLRNGGFNFCSPATASGFDFSAKKENLTPMVSATPGNFSSVSFNFGASTVAAPGFKFGEPKLSSGGSSGDAVHTSVSTPAMTRISCGVAKDLWDILTLVPLPHFGRGTLFEWTAVGGSRPPAPPRVTAHSAGALFSTQFAWILLYLRRVMTLYDILLPGLSEG
ncbi:Ladybird homeobox corepressor 1-like protein [Echinococcus granulosus]|uniref:Ladybird homeobox corepressor 1-like protein n=1 Tax=Echinococcus granulosus TaxID=6210 RepID=W6UTW3_ECHGR|nr:Ladybird homeobox corepressor 1-like protein [Echinococcus granulosus]EUB61807.1 Ladybird homeobox corepressor 1-like protein [Echinococcus granulosus]